MSGEDAPRPYLENLIVLEIKTNKQTSEKASEEYERFDHSPTTVDGAAAHFVEERQDGSHDGCVLGEGITSLVPVRRTCVGVRRMHACVPGGPCSMEKDRRQQNRCQFHSTTINPRSNETHQAVQKSRIHIKSLGKAHQGAQRSGVRKNGRFLWAAAA
jgi:hypothetical protein